MTNNHQLEQDIARNALDRLHTWVKDTAMRCDVVDIEPDRQTSIIAGCLTHKMIEMWEMAGIQPADAGRIVHNIYKDWLELEERIKSKQKPKVK